MTVLFHVVQRRHCHSREAERVIGALFNEVLYADDTMCVARGDSDVNTMVAGTVEEGIEMGMVTNAGKSEALVFGEVGGLWLGGVLIDKVHVAKHLGCS